MWNLLITLNKNLFIAIPVMLLLGFGCGVLCDPSALKHAIVPLTFLMVYPMMVTLKLRKVFQRGDDKAQWLAQAINFGIIPFAVLFIGRLFFPNEPYLALGLLLAGLVPTSGMTISWTGFAKGNVEAAVKMTVIGLVLGSLATPVYVRLLMGADINMDVALVVRQILLIVFLPMGAGHLTQSLLLRRYGQDAFQKRMAPRFPALSALGVLGIVFVAMALKAKSIDQSPDLLVSIFTPIMIIYALNFALSTWVGRRLLSRGDAIALVYGTVMRNLSIALALAINAFGAEGAGAALVVALSYVVQVQSAAWYVKFTERIFGPPLTAAAPYLRPAAAVPVKAMEWQRPEA
ncbi:MAG: arsenic resistance protein [Desulfobacteraceae bacterium]|nr:MAG: arsenic resistance protein [Desulfobacteraceae bacterium]